MWDDQPSTDDVQVIEINNEIELLPKDRNAKDPFLNEELCKDMLSKISENVNYLHLKTKSKPNVHNVPEVDLELRVTNGSLNDDRSGNIAIENVEIKKQTKQENEDEIQNSVIKIQNNNLRLVDDSDNRSPTADRKLNDKSTNRFNLTDLNQAIQSSAYDSTSASIDVHPPIGGIAAATTIPNYLSDRMRESERVKKLLSSSALQTHIKPTVKVDANKMFKDDDIYPICSKPRGYCLIINNVDFARIYEERKGSDLEAKYLEEIFKQLDFKVLYYRNLTSLAMLECFKKIVKQPELSQHDAFISIILTHGDDSRVLIGTDASTLKVDKFLHYFTNANCPQLKNKPKLFFIQACRGSDHDYGTYDLVACTVSDAAPVKTANTKVRKELKELNKLNDVLIVNSTLDGFVSLRNEISGSWFGDALGFALCEHSKDDELQKLLGLVSDELFGDKLACSKNVFPC